MLKNQSSESILFTFCGDCGDLFNAELCVHVYSTWQPYTKHTVLWQILIHITFWVILRQSKLRKAHYILIQQGKLIFISWICGSCARRVQWECSRCYQRIHRKYPNWRTNPSYFPFFWLQIPKGGNISWNVMAWWLSTSSA
jgi:hypothetical protein